MAAPTALITGIAGQDGSYLAQLLLDRGYQVFGLVRGSTTASFERLVGFQDRLKVLAGDMLDQTSLLEAVRAAQPDEIYNLAAQSLVPRSWRQPVLTGDVTAVGAGRLLEAVRQAAPEARLYQAGSCEVYGAPLETPQNERTPFNPRNPYAAAKAHAHYLAASYRDNYGLFTCAGIAFTHTSPRRGLDFVSRKITYGAARVRLGLASDLRLGNLDAERDWTFAGDVAEAMHRMLTADRADDYVIGSGETHSVRDWVETVFEALDAPLAWEGSGDDEVARDPDGRVVARVEADLRRNGDADKRVADASRARRELGWAPSMNWGDLVMSMVKADYDRVTREKEGRNGS